MYVLISQSGCGWPAFFDGTLTGELFLNLPPNDVIAIPGAVSRHEDKSLGMRRIEITCTACGGHLGHVFQGEGFPTPSCVKTKKTVLFLFS